MIIFLKYCQLAVSFGVIGMIWQFYPGAMVIFASAVGLAYVAASFGAIRDNRIAIWVALLFSVVTAGLAALGVSRFMRNGFDFLAGKFDQHSEILIFPYVFIAISIGAALVTVLHLASWRWVLRGRQIERM
jgi:hypothetical protein